MRISTPLFVLCGALLLPAVVHAQEPAPRRGVLELGAGVGGAGLAVTGSPPGEADGGLAGSLFARGFHPTGHGAGARLAGAGPVSLVGGGYDYGLGSFDVRYLHRVGGRPTDPVSLTVGAGPALVWGGAHFDGDCFIGCPTRRDDEDDYDTLALGGSVSAAGAAHLGRAVVETSVTWQEGWAVEETPVDRVRSVAVEVRFATRLDL